MKHTILMRKITTIHESEYICDTCGKLEKKDFTEWYLIYTARRFGVRLFEKDIRKPGLERLSHHQQEETYCSQQCAKERLLSDIDLFLSEVKSPQARSNIEIY